MAARDVQERVGEQGEDDPAMQGGPAPDVMPVQGGEVPCWRRSLPRSSTWIRARRRETAVHATSRHSKLPPSKPWINPAVELKHHRHGRVARRTEGPRLDRQRRPMPLCPPVPGPGGRTAADPGLTEARQIAPWLLSRHDRLDRGAGSVRPLPAHKRPGQARDELRRDKYLRTGERELKGWLPAVQGDGKPHLHSFAASNCSDRQAVTNGLTPLPPSFTGLTTRRA